MKEERESADRRDAARLRAVRPLEPQ